MFRSLVSIFIALMAGTAAAQTTQLTNPSSPAVRIVLVGDSTVTPNAGWGSGFAASMDPSRVEVIDLAKGGRSSKSFIHEGLWQEALDLKPDYVLIQFGHNDQKLNDPTRGTDPATTYRQFMTQYVDDARAAGIKPILVTSLSRRQWGKDGKIHSGLTPYANVVKEIAAEKHVPLIDLHELSIELYEKLGNAQVVTMSATKPSTAPSDDPSEHVLTVVDGTHLNAKGSAVVGRIVADEMARVVPELAKYVIPAPASQPSDVTENK